MRSHICAVLHELLIWAESCPCHGDLIAQFQDSEDSHERELCSVWRSCPFRGCRAPELASGDFMALVHQIWEVEGADLVPDMPRALSPEQRSAVEHTFALC